MPGPGITAPYGPTYNGMVWDAASGGYVSPVNASANAAATAGNNAAASIATGTAAGTYHAPMSAAEQASAALGTSTLAANTAGQQAALSETSRANQAGEALGASTLAERARSAQAGEALGTSTLAEQQRAARASEGLASERQSYTEMSDTQRRAMIQGLMNTIQGGTGPGITPINPNGGAGGGADPTGGGGSIPPATSGGAGGGGGVTGGGGGGGTDPNAMSPYDMAAENAAYGAAKERTGNEAQMALKGLQGTLAQRGVSGGGIEAADTRGIFEGALGQQAATDRSLAENRSGRVFAAQAAARDMAEKQREYNLSFQQSEQQRIATAQAQRLSALMAAAGMY